FWLTSWRPSSWCPSSSPPSSSWPSRTSNVPGWVSSATRGPWSSRSSVFARSRPNIKGRRQMSSGFLGSGPGQSGSQLDAGGAELAHEAGLVDRLEVRLVGRHELSLHEVHERVVHQDHSVLAPGLHDARDLERLALANQIRDRRRPDQDLHRRDAPPSRLLAQHLRDHALQG